MRFFKECCKTRQTQLNNLQTFFNNGMWSELLEAIDSAPPNHEETMYFRGVALARSGQNDEAISVLKQLDSEKPLRPEVKLALGNALLASQKQSEAITYFIETLNLDRENKIAWINLARAYFEKGKTTLAKRALLKALDIDQQNREARLYLAKIYTFEKNYNNANHILNHFDFDLSDIEVIQALVNLWVNDDDHAKALALINSAIQQTSDSTPADHAKLESIKGYILQSQGNLEEAYSSFRKSLEMDDSIAETHFNLGLLQLDLGMRNESKNSFLRAKELSPNDLPTKWQLSLFELSSGNFGVGWQDYGLRFMSEDGMQRDFGVPMWKGEKVRSGELLITAEQGLGDEIMFSSCLIDLFSKAPQPVIECHPKLENIYRISFPQATIIGRNQTLENEWLKDYPEVKYFFPIGSLPRLFRNHINDFPSRPGHLVANPEISGKWGKKLRSLGAGPKIGISWQGGLKNTRSSIRSIPLNRWKNILEIPGAHFISLQYTDCKEEIDNVNKKFGSNIHHWQEALRDYEETAGLVSSLDVVVSVQTAVVHLSGALGVKCFALISASPEWCYMAEGRKIPWYSSVVLFRQKKLNIWNDVIENVNQSLKANLKIQATK